MTRLNPMTAADLEAHLSDWGPEPSDDEMYAHYAGEDEDEGPTAAGLMSVPAPAEAPDDRWHESVDFAAPGGAEGADHGPHDGAAADDPPIDARQPRIVRRTWDDIGNSERLVDHFGMEIRYAIDAEQWVTYEGGRWIVRGASTKVWQRVIATIDRLPQTEALLYEDSVSDGAAEQMIAEPAGKGDGSAGKAQKEKTPRKAFLAWARQQRMRGRLAAMRDIASGQQRLHCEMSIFDRPEMLLNVANGVVDLTSGHIRNHDPRLYLMQQSPVRFDPTATCPMWDTFLEGVMPDPERRAYLARVVGYTLTGSTEEQVMFLHHGSGQNGKGVFIRILMSLLGDYAQSVPRSTLLAKQGEGIPNDVARMMGKRLLSTTETSAGKKLDDELVKQLTGEDTVSARYLNKEFFDFRPVGKIHLATNYLPHVGGGHGIARRLQDIGWDVTIPPERKIAKLDEKIMQNEASGVLNWAIRGCRDWQENGLAVPEAVREKTREHLANSDPLAMWLSECTEAANADEYTETKLLFANYKAWCQSGSLREMTIKSFSDALHEKSFERGNHPVNRRSIFKGIKLCSF